MASKAIGFLNFKFGADLSGFDRAMNKAQKKLKKFGRNVQKTGKSLTMGLTVPIAALGVASIKAFDQQEKAIAQVEAGLKSTAGTVGFTSKELQKMAADLQKTTLFGDEEILKDSTAQLLTFTNITGKEFAKTQEVVLDLATRLDGDLKSSAIMLGKALNDPVANLSALSRAGIQFSEEQKSTVKSLVETNDLAGAQTLILAELEKQYGGSAEAAAQAGMGPITQLNNQLSDLSEQIGARLVPIVQTFVTWITGLAEKFDGLSESTKDSIVKWGLMLAAVGPILIIIGKMSTGIGALIPIVKALTATLAANPWLILVAAIVLASKAIYDFATTTHGAAKAKQDLLNVEKNAIVAAKEEERILLNKLKLARDVTKSDEERKGAIVDLNNKLVGLNGTLNLENIAETNVTNAINEHTQALINQAKIAGITDLISENFAKMTKASLDGREAVAGMFTIEGVLQAGTHFANTVGGVLEGEDVMTAGKNAGKKLVGNYMDGLSEQEKVLTAELEKLGGITPPPIKVEADLGDAGDLMDNWTPPDPEELDKVKVKVEADSKEAIEELQEFYAQSQNLEKQNLVDGAINQEEYNKRVWEDKVSHLEQLKTIHEQYGESTTKIDGEILDAKLAGYKKEEKAIVEVKSKLEEFTEELKKNIEDLFGGFDFEEIDEAFAAAFERAMALFDSFNEKMRVKAENERKVEMEALDADYEKKKEQIENSLLSEEEKATKLKGLDKTTADAKVAIEEATEAKMAKIKKREAVRNKALAIMSAIINTAKAVSAALPVIPLAIAAGAMGAIQVGIISSTPLPLAEGGIVTGPTTALIGEYAGAGSNPEVVAPLDRLKGLLGESSQHITVSGKLVGNDIWLSNDFAGEHRKRFT
tara:strand:- start:3671 stop:6298 length:2628 start_codon:yes stop_codon:yes gene_type:complete